MKMFSLLIRSSPKLANVIEINYKAMHYFGYKRRNILLTQEFFLGGPRPGNGSEGLSNGVGLKVTIYPQKVLMYSSSAQNSP